jgi:hypothetical protein
MAFIDVEYEWHGSPETMFVVSPVPMHGADYIYNLTDAVGLGARNLDEDVAVVQTMLSEIASRRILVPGLQPGLKVDGRFGPLTQSQIRVFQKYIKSRGAPITTDGQIDRARGAVGSISGTIYTILYLNGCFWKVRPEYYPDIDHDEYTKWPLPPVFWRIRARGVAHMSV